MCLNGGLSEVMLLGFVLFVCWTQKIQYRVAG